LSHNPQDSHLNIEKERIVWRNAVTSGIIHKKIVETQLITNFRVISNNFQLPLKDVDDIVVMNQNRLSQSYHTGSYSGRYVRTGFGNSISISETRGDVVFIHLGNPTIIFRQISDPHGVARLAKATRKNAITIAKMVQQNSNKINSELSSESEGSTDKVKMLHYTNSTVSGKSIPGLKWQLLSPMVHLDLLHNEEYDIGILGWSDAITSPGKDCNKMIIHPLEGGNCLEFRNKEFKNYFGSLLEIRNLKDARSIESYHGLLKRKSHSLELIFVTEEDFEHERDLGIRIDIDEKYIPQVIDKLQKLRQLSENNFWIQYKQTYLTNTSEGDKTLEIFPIAPFISGNEEILWYYIESSNNEVKIIQTITRFRIFEYNYETSLGKAILLPDLEGAVVTNEKKSSFRTSNVGTMARIRHAITITEVNNNNMPSKIVGDVVFMKEGQPAVTFNQISRPNDVATLAMSAKNQFFSAISTNLKETITEVSNENNNTNRLL
jgi:hypothetical protein